MEYLLFWCFILGVVYVILLAGIKGWEDHGRELNEKYKRMMKGE